MTKNGLALTLAFACGVLWNATARDAEAQFRADEFDYGSRFKLADGESADIWNPAKRKLLDGGPLIGGTVRATDPRTYCAMASAGYDFIWVEMQHAGSPPVAHVPRSGRARSPGCVCRRTRDPARDRHRGCGHRCSDRGLRSGSQGSSRLDVLPPDGETELWGRTGTRRDLE